MCIGGVDRLILTLTPLQAHKTCSISHWIQGIERYSSVGARTYDVNKSL